MSSFKQYSQQGLADDVQWGKGGGRIVFKDGVFQVVATPTGDDLSRLKAADPVDPSDVATLASVTTAVNHVYAKLDNVSNSLIAETQALSTSLNTTQAGLASLQSVVAATKLDTITSADGTTSVHAATDGIHLTGTVLIGDGSQDGLIQPEGGHSLTIAGGDADTAGSVVIRGGHGTTPGHVEIHDLLDPAAPQDPVTRAYSEKMFTAAAISIMSGSYRSVAGTFAETSGDTAVVQVPAGTLTRLKVLVLAPFASGATITVKTSTSTLAVPAVIDESQAGIYLIELLQDTPADTVTVSVTTTGGSGKGALALEYISA